MDNNIMLILGFIGALLPIIGIVVKVSNSLTKLNVTMENLNEKITKEEEAKEDIENTLNNHETRLVVLENKRS